MGMCRPRQAKATLWLIESFRGGNLNPIPYLTGIHKYHTKEKEEDPGKKSLHLLQYLQLIVKGYIADWNEIV